ncbi:MAG: hypothetical protein ABIB71_06690 [Candidatus Woesearchaeota archaeon]
MRRGQIWISVVLYMALGVIALTLILTAGVPLVQKMKDKNTFAQTKSLFFTLDSNIMAVTNEGPGSIRLLTPFEIKEGNFYVDDENEIIKWNMKTSAKLLEPTYDMKGCSCGRDGCPEPACFVDEDPTQPIYCAYSCYILKTKPLDYDPTWPTNCTYCIQKLKEGPVTFYTNETIDINEYWLTFELDYSNVADIQLESGFEPPFKGIYSLKVTATGEYTDNKYPIVKIEITG